MKRPYIVQVNDYMRPVKVMLTENEANAVAYVLEEIVKSDEDALVEIKDADSGEILFDNYIEWARTHD